MDFRFYFGNFFAVVEERLGFRVGLVFFFRLGLFLCLGF